MRDFLVNTLIATIGILLSIHFGLVRGVLFRIIAGVVTIWIFRISLRLIANKIRKSDNNEEI